MTRPNVVWIVADQLHHAHLGCAGNDVVRTPNIDRLAAAGATFTRAYCQAPLCMPSRASFNTGLYPHACRVRHNPVVLDDEFPTLAERLAGAGYATGGFGHIGGDGVERGFAEKVDFPDEPLRSAYMREQEHVLADGGKPTGFCGVHPLPLEQTFDYLATDLAVDFLRRADRPFYLQLDLMKPHIPLVVPEPYASMHAPADVTLPESWRDELADKPANVRGTRVATRMEGVSEDDMRRSLAHYYGAISFIDAQVGRVLETLDARGQADDTLIVFASDHGDYAGEFGLIGKTGQFYDALVRVPLILAGSGIPAGRRTDALVELVDLAATILDACGLDVPPDLNGRSRLPLARGQTDDGADAVFAETGGGRALAPSGAIDLSKLAPSPTDPYSSGPVSHRGAGVMVRDDGYKLTVYGDGTMELYDTIADPGERTNLAGRNGTADVIVRLQSRLLQWQMETWLPDRPQTPLPYHYRSCAKFTLSGETLRRREQWDREHGHA